MILSNLKAIGFFAFIVISVSEAAVSRPVCTVLTSPSDSIEVVVDSAVSGSTESPIAVTLVEHPSQRATRFENGQVPSGAPQGTAPLQVSKRMVSAGLYPGRTSVSTPVHPDDANRLVEWTVVSLANGDEMFAVSHNRSALRSHPNERTSLSHLKDQFLTFGYRRNTQELFIQICQ